MRYIAICIGALVLFAGSAFAEGAAPSDLNVNLVARTAGAYSTVNSSDVQVAVTVFRPGAQPELKSATATNNGFKVALGPCCAQTKAVVKVNAGNGFHPASFRLQLAGGKTFNKTYAILRAPQVRRVASQGSTFVQTRATKGQPRHMLTGIFGNNCCNDCCDSCDNDCGCGIDLCALRLPSPCDIKLPNLCCLRLPNLCDIRLPNLCNLKLPSPCGCNTGCNDCDPCSNPCETTPCSNPCSNDCGCENDCGCGCGIDLPSPCRVVNGVVSVPMGVVRGVGRIFNALNPFNRCCRPSPCGCRR